MAQKVNPDFANQLARFGAKQVSTCFNCGNCTAVCSLSEGGAAFPRKLIRYAQLGLKDRLMDMVEPWLCYYCGDCSATCPRGAGPGETMAALRRYAIASADPSGLASLMYRRPGAAVLATLALAVVLGLFLVSLHPAHGLGQWLFRLVPYEAVHTVGMGVSAVFGVLAIAGAFRVLRRYAGGLSAEQRRFGAVRPAIAALRKTLVEIATMRRHGRCRESEPVSEPWYRAPRWVHAAIMWGFFGLFGATLLDFLFIYFLGWEEFPPARVLGTVSGLIMLYGVSLSFYQRVRGRAVHLKESVLADWWLLVFLLVLAATGFWLELVETLRWQAGVNDAVLLVHTIMAMELVLLVTLTKLAHALYRPLALWFHFYRQTVSLEHSQAPEPSSTTG
ncbi:MAG: 4Fe-4S dicluster domain-containing protein [Candidatus Omnitrophica bacterium]|nr:4Fe-4S dicluster domain-containing protein [Candidatus Omnitrophota bacterium]